MFGLMGGLWYHPQNIHKSSLDLGEPLLAKRLGRSFATHTHTYILLLLLKDKLHMFKEF